MVQIIENATRISGKVLEASAHEQGMRIVLQVEASEPVAGLPSLIDAAPGRSVELVVPAEAASALKPGATLTVEASLKGPGVIRGRVVP